MNRPRKPHTPDWLSYTEAYQRILSDLFPDAVSEAEDADRPGAVGGRASDAGRDGESGRRHPVLGTERLPIDEALGRAVAEVIRSRVDHPPWDVSAMDGFAVRAEELEGATPDTPIQLPVSDDIPAGSFPAGPLAPGTVARVMTGAPVPEGATGVVRVEHTTEAEAADHTRFLQATDARRNIRRRGEDVSRGDEILSPGADITPAAVGMLALTGHVDVLVRCRPRIAIIATGDELADLDQVDLAIRGDRLMNSNSHALGAQVRSAGGIPVLLPIARDDPSEIRARFEEALDCDAIISTGGVSVGDRDHVQDVLEALGFQRTFWRARIRPGSPLLVGRLHGRPFWGLPGNPVSAMVTFEVFFRDAIRALGGHNVRSRAIDVTIGEELELEPTLTHFLRVRLRRGLTGRPEAYLTGSQSSGVLSSMNEADALLIIDPRDADSGTGDLASALPLR